MTGSRSAGYALDPSMPVLLRPDGTVQVGWDPRRAVLVHPPPGWSTPALATLLRTMQSPATLADLRMTAAQSDVRDLSALADLIGSLVDTGVVTVAPPRRRRAASIRIHGRGPLSDLMTSGLRCSGARIRHTAQPHATVAAESTDLVVLTDFLMADPRVLRELHTAGVAHLPVRVRDGAGLVGPLVIPGVTSCLECANLHRTDRDDAWPAVAAQLRGTVGTADRATLLATAALALNQVDQIIQAVGTSDRHDPPPETLDTTLEFHVKSREVVTRRWTRHPRCGC